MALKEGPIASLKHKSKQKTQKRQKRSVDFCFLLNLLDTFVFQKNKAILARQKAPLLPLPTCHAVGIWKHDMSLSK